jgi:hypothetical protein
LYQTGSKCTHVRNRAPYAILRCQLPAGHGGSHHNPHVAGSKGLFWDDHEGEHIHSQAELEALIERVHEEGQV